MAVDVCLFVCLFVFIPKDSSLCYPSEYQLTEIHQSNTAEGIPHNTAAVERPS